MRITLRTDPAPDLGLAAQAWARELRARLAAHLGHEVAWTTAGDDQRLQGPDGLVIVVRPADPPGAALDVVIDDDQAPTAETRHRVGSCAGVVGFLGWLVLLVMSGGFMWTQFKETSSARERVIILFVVLLGWVLFPGLAYMGASSLFGRLQGWLVAYTVVGGANRWCDQQVGELLERGPEDLGLQRG